MLDAALAQAARDWERDLRPLLPHFVDADVALQGIAALKQITAT